MHTGPDEASIRIDIDLGHAQLCGPPEFIGIDAFGSEKFAAGGIDARHFILRHGTAAMHHQRKTGKQFLNAFEHLEVKPLSPAELEGPMAGPDGTCQGIATALFDKLLGLGRISELGIRFGNGNVLFDATQLPKFGFHGNALGVSGFHDPAGGRDVLLETLMAGIDHHGTVEPAVDAIITGFFITMVQVNGENGFREYFLGTADQPLEHGLVSIAARPFTDLDNKRCLTVKVALEKAHALFQVVDVVGPDRVFAISNGEEIFGGDNHAVHPFLNREMRQLEHTIPNRLQPARKKETGAVAERLMAVYYIPDQSGFTRCLERKREVPVVRFQCSYCKAILAIDDCQPGEAVACGQCGNAIAVPESRLSAGAVVGDFVIRKDLGHGGMGSVYLAHQISLDRPAAVKVLHPQFSADENYIADFIREARAAASINHPNIVQAYAVGNDDGLYFFAMEYVEGSTLKQVLLHGGRMVPERALAIAKDVGEALEFAWSTQRLVHRDIKPDNIILTATGRTKLADLGLARRFQAESVSEVCEELHGTPQYISPEQLLGYPGNNLSDIYSLGATLYHALTGQFPFAGDNPADIAEKHLNESLLPPNALVPEIPAAVSIMVENMMAKRPADRYSSTAEFLADLTRVRSGEMPMREVAVTAQVPISSGEDSEIVVEEEAVVPPAPAYEPAIEEDEPEVSSPKIKIAAKSGRSMKLRAPGSPLPAPREATPAAPVNVAVEPEEAVAEEEIEEPAGTVVEDAAEVAVPSEEAVSGDSDEGSDDADGLSEPAEAGEGKGKRPTKILVFALVGFLLVLGLGYGGYRFFLGGGTPASEGGSPESRRGPDQPKAGKNALKDLKELISSGAQEAEVVGRLTALAPEYGDDEEFLSLAAPYVERALKAPRGTLVKADLGVWEARAKELAEAAKAAREAEEERQKQEQAKREQAEREQAEREAEAARRVELTAKQDELRWQAIDLCRGHKYSDAAMLFVRLGASRDPEAQAWAAGKQMCINLAEQLFQKIYNTKKKMAGVKFNIQGKDWTVSHVSYRYIEIERESTRYEKGQAFTENYEEKIPFEDLTPQQMYALSSRLWELDGLDPDEHKLEFGAYLLARGEFLAQAKKQLADLDDERAKMMLTELDAISPTLQKREFAKFLEELQNIVNQGDRKQIAYQIRKMKALCPDEFAAREEEVKQLLGGP